MPVHDWTRVHGEIFHNFHLGWTVEIARAFNTGLLPSDYYALVEQHADRTVADIMTLHGGPAVDKPLELVARRRSLAIRHVSGHRLIALLEMVSSTNKDCAPHVQDLANKVLAALDAGVHVLLVDVFPPGLHDPLGVHGAIWLRLERSHSPDEPPVARPLTLAAYVARSDVEAYLQYLAVGAPLPDTPLFLHSDRYINVPLERTYVAAYAGMPEFWRDVLEGRSPPGFAV